MSEIQTDGAPAVSAPQSSETAATPEVGAPDTPETTVAETDEQINERVQREARERSEKQARGVRKRIDELTADKYAERQRAEQLAQQNAQLMAWLQKQQQPQQPSDGEPQRKDFDDYEAYLEKRAEWRAEQRAAKIVEEQLGRVHEQQARAQMGQLVQAVDERFHAAQTEFAKATPDYAEVLASATDVQIADEVGLILKAMPDGPALAYHLAKHPQIAEQMRGQPLPMQTWVLGQLSAQLKSSPQVSKAPAPGQPVVGKSLAKKGLADMDYDEFVKARRAQTRAG